MALVLGSIAVLVHSALTSPGSPRQLYVHVASIQQTGEQFLVIIEVGNEGGSTAADTRIESDCGSMERWSSGARRLWISCRRRRSGGRAYSFVGSRRQTS